MRRQRCGELKVSTCSAFVMATMLCVGTHLWVRKTIAAEVGHATITVDAQQIAGKVSPLLFGHFIEEEHNTIQDGLWSELLHDRKFEQGDRNHDGVSDGWEPEERIADRYWQLVEGQGPNVRYFVDHQEYYGGSASQAIELHGSGSNHSSIYQIGLQLARGRRYDFYVYLKCRGKGRAFVELDRLGGPRYGRKEYTALSERWQKYTAEFTAPEDTSAARIRIGFEGVGTFWMDSASLMPADNLGGMRRDVVNALRPLHIPLMRFPGGCFADYYHWKLGIGPRDQRPAFWGTAWAEWNDNDFGIDEYMDLARELGFEGHITTNYVSGTVKEAAEWVEYANGSVDTPLGRRRGENGHPEPYGIKYWAVGNEAPSLCSEQFTGGTGVSNYAERFREYESAMHSVDPSIQIMASSVGQPTWVHDLLKTLPVSLLAPSIYTGAYENGTDTKIRDYDEFYRKVVAEPLDFNRKLEANIRAAGSFLPHDHPFFAITEFNSWWLSETVDPDYRLPNALYFAGVFHSLLRHTQEVLMAEVSTTLNVQGIIEINSVALKLTPPYFAYLLYRNHIGKAVLATRTKGPMTSFNDQLSALDAVATLNEDGEKLYLAVINRDETRDISATIHINGWTPRPGTPAQVILLNGKDKVAANPYGSPTEVNIRETTAAIGEHSASYRFPAHSVAVLAFTGKP
jgi:alpha-L-arabinofuranosidase